MPPKTSLFHTPILFFLLLSIHLTILPVSGWNNNREHYSPVDLSPKYLSDIDQRSSIDLSLSQLPYCDGDLSLCRDKTLGYLLIAAQPKGDSKQQQQQNHRYGQQNRYQNQDQQQKALKPKRTFDLHGGGDIAIQCANKCSTIQRSGGNYQRCVAYAYDYSTNKCSIYDKIQLDKNWKESLVKHQQLPSQLEDSDNVVFAISVPRMRKLGRQNWIETQEVPIAKGHLGKIESQFSDCQRCSKFGCTFFSYQISDRKCYYFPNDRPNYEADYDEDEDDEKFMKLKSDYQTLYRLPELSGELREEEEAELIHNKQGNSQSQNYNNNGNNNGNYNNKPETGEVDESESETDENLPENNDPQELNCFEDGFNVNPNDCSKFFRCHAGFRFDFECPPGTLYSHLIKTCDHSSKVDCGAQMKARIQAYSPPTCQGLHPHFFSHPDCTKFYQCNLGMLFAFDCAPGTHFNAETGLCDYPHLAGCIARQSSTVSQPQDNGPQAESRPQSKAPKRTHVPSPTKAPEPSRLQPPQIRAPKPRPVQESWVEYEPENDKKPSAALRRKSHKKPAKVENAKKKFEKCTPKSKTPCTLSNFDWLHLPDMEFEGQQNEQSPQSTNGQKSVKKTLNPMSDEGMDECHELCLDYNPKDGLPCVGYSYNNQTMKCELFGELELPGEWLQNLKDSEPTSPPKGFRHSPGTNSRIHLQDPQIVLGQWLISPDIPEKLGPRSGRNVVVSDFRPAPYNTKIKHFIDCLNACAKQPKCTEFVYNSIDKQCLTKVKNSKDKNPDNKNKKTTYKSGWISGRKLSDIVEQPEIDQEDVKKRVTKNAFMMQNDGELLDLLEQYQLEKSNKPLFSLSNGENKHLNPMEVISMKNPEDCEDRCARDSDSELHQAKRKKRDDSESRSEEGQDSKKRCKFVTIQRHLLSPKQNITCSLYSDDIFDTEIALLSRDLEKQTNQVSDTNKLIGSVFGTKPLERTKRQSSNDNKRKKLIPSREHYEIVSYPKEEDAAAVRNIEEFFAKLRDERFKNSGLVSIGSLVEIPNKEYCLRYCLKQWQEPEAPFNDDIQCHALSLSYNHESQDFTCTFYDRPNHSKSAGTVFYQLTHLLEESKAKKNIEKAFHKNTPLKLQLEQISHYQPIQEFPNVDDSEACLQGCLDTWKSNDSLTRCRLVLVNTTEVERSDRTFLKPRYDCSFYDFQFDLNDEFAQKEMSDIRVFHKPKNAKDFEQIPDTLTEQILEAVEAQTKAFYHHSKAGSANECLDTCKNIRDKTNITKRCALVVVRKSLHKSQITQRSVAEFQCAFYENPLQINFHDGSESMHKKKSSAKAKAFKVVLDPETQKPKTEEIDIESAAVNYATATYDPISTLWNTTEASHCSEYCLRMIKNNVGNCQTALWNSMECKIYAFNSTNIKLEDFNAKTEIKGYTLKEQEGTLSSLLLKFKSVNYTEKFRQIRHLGPFLNPLRGRRAYESKIVEKPENCFETCLEKWTSASITKQRRLCRFVTIRNISQTELECSLYSHNATQALQSIRVVSPIPILDFVFDKRNDSSTVASWNGSIYRKLEWSLPLPVAMEDGNIQEHQLDHLGDCLAQCDDEGGKCLAMLAEYSGDENPTKIVKCYTVGDGEYTPAEGMTEKKMRRPLKMFVKTSNIDAEMRQAKDKKNSKQTRNQNAFMALLKFVALYERQEPLAQLFNSL